MKITDGTRTAEITMTGLNGADWSTDFIGTDVVDNVNDYIESAIDWLKEENNEEYDVEIVENGVTTRYIIEDGELVKLVF